MNVEKVLDFLLDLAMSLGTKIIFALIVLIVGHKIVKFVKKRVLASDKIKKVDPGVQSFLSSFIVIALYIVIFITIAMILGIPTTSFITALASCGVAIGLALQGALGNLAGGIIILVFKPFRVGDYISTQGEEGKVTKITIMYTSLTTVDNKNITIPNGTLTNAVVENYSYEQLRRVDFVFSASYDSDMEKVKLVIMKVLESHEKVLKEPAPFVRMSKHTNNALEFTTRAWCNSEDYWDVNFDIIEQVNRAFKENDISIPYPQFDVHIEKE